MQALQRRAGPLVCTGFTLVELMVTVVVAITTMAIAIPSYRTLVEHQHLVTQTNQLVANLHFARSAAVKRRQRVALCPSSDGQSCAGGFDWSGGWLVFVDQNRDRERQADEPVLRTAAVAGQTTIVTSSGRRRVVYEPDGSVIGGSNATFRICTHANAGGARAVIVSNAGRPRLSERDASNQPVVCS